MGAHKARSSWTESSWRAFQSADAIKFQIECCGCAEAEKDREPNSSESARWTQERQRQPLTTPRSGRGPLDVWGPVLERESRRCACGSLVSGRRTGTHWHDLTTQHPHSARAGRSHCSIPTLFQPAGWRDATMDLPSVSPRKWVDSSMCAPSPAILLRARPSPGRLPTPSTPVFGSVD